MTVKKQKRRVEWTPEVTDEFFRILGQTGNVSYSCRAINVERKGAYKHKRKDPEFAERWEEALAESCDSLEAEARRRAMGWKEKGVSKFSDVLLIFLLKGNNPDKFGDKYKSETKGTLKIEIVQQGDVKESIGTDDKNTK